MIELDFLFLELFNDVRAPCAAVGVAVYCARTQHVLLIDVLGSIGATNTTLHCHGFAQIE